MNNPKVSICVPVYGVEKYIERCAVSLFEQTYSNIEYIFVNDCTKDKSMQVLESVINRYPQRKDYIRIINHTPNKGLAGVRNTAVENATGEFISHVDSDDWVDKDMIEKMVAKQRETNTDIITCGCKQHDNKKTWTWMLQQEKDPQKVAANIISRTYQTNIWGRLIRRRLYIDNHLKADEAISNSEDYQIVPKLFYLSSKIEWTLNTYYHYNRMNEDSYSVKRSLNNDIQLWRSFDILWDYFKDKEGLFKNAFKIGEVRMISWGLKHLNKMDNPEQYLAFLMKRLNTVDKSYYHYVDILSRIAFCIHNKNLICAFLDIKDKL